jgi:hypothetical protein
VASTLPDTDLKSEPGVPGLAWGGLG